MDREITCESFDITMGSSAVFTACAYALLGGQSAFLGLAGQDDYGTFMLQGMQQFGVDTHLVRLTDAVKTGVTLNLIYQDSRTQITYPGTIAELQKAHIDPTVLQQVDHVHFSGIYQQQKLKPALTELLHMARQQQTTVSLDPQWDETERWEGMADWLPLLSYLFINTAEAQSLTNTPRVEDAWNALAARTPCPLIKAGRQGCLVPGASGMTWVPAFNVDVVDTIGAGDAFAAGFLFGIKEQGMTIPEAARFGNAAGARNCTSVGGIHPGLTYQSIMQFLETQP
jgi:sugar/nucleoside kinase (ribokinase family)